MSKLFQKLAKKLIGLPFFTNKVTLTVLKQSLNASKKPIWEVYATFNDLNAAIQQEKRTDPNHIVYYETTVIIAASDLSSISFNENVKFKITIGNIEYNVNDIRFLGIAQDEASAVEFLIKR